MANVAGEAGERAEVRRAAETMGFVGPASRVTGQQVCRQNPDTEFVHLVVVCSVKLLSLLVLDGALSVACTPTDREAPNALRAEFVGRVRADFIPGFVGNHPCGAAGIQADVDVLADLRFANITRPMIQRDAAAGVHMPPHHMLGNELQDSRQLPVALLPVS